MHAPYLTTRSPFPDIVDAMNYSTRFKVTSMHRVCNGTQNLVGVAIGYRAKEGWITEGWWQVPATTCATLIEGELQSRYYYLYAEDAARGGRWTGDVQMCVAENEFKITGVQDCYARGYQKMGFKEYDTGRQGSWMVQLSDTPGTQESQN